MMLLTCAAVQRRLPAFHDRELPIAEQIAIETHLHDCPPCARDLHGLQQLGRALREASAPAPPDDWTGVRSGVISRMRAEAHESWTAKGRRAFDDLHLVWIALATAHIAVGCHNHRRDAVGAETPSAGENRCMTSWVLGANITQTKPATIASISVRS